MLYGKFWRILRPTFCLDHRWLLLVFGLCEAVGQHIEVSAGAYWKPLPDAIAYEASIPLTYQSTWNDDGVEPVSRNHKCNANNEVTRDYCEFLSHIDMVSEAIDAEFSAITKQWDTNIFKSIARNDSLEREKRGIDFIGDFASFCCNIATQKKFDSLVIREETLRKQMFKINKGLESSLKMIAKNSQHFNELNSQNKKIFTATENKIKDIQNIINKFQNNTIREQHEIWNLIGVMLEFQNENNVRFVQLVRQFKRQDIINACNRNLIPTAIINPATLYNDLLTLQQQLHEKGQDLAVKSQDVSTLYQLPICDCSLTSTNIIIHIKIPIIQNYKQWVLFELKTTPFKWSHDTCIIDHNTLYMAVSQNTSMDDNIRQISGMGLHNCKPYHDRLCYIPRFAADSVQGPACARKLFIGDSVQEIAKYCTMRCYKSTATIISELDESTYLVTHMKTNTAMWCAGTIKNITNNLIEAPGAVKIRLPCNCELRIGMTQLIPKRFPCPEQTLEFTEITHVLPAIWTKLRSFVLNPVARAAPPKFKNMSEALNTNWTFETPYINISSTQDTIASTFASLKNSPAIYDAIDIPSFHNNTIILVWNSLISIVLIYLVLHRNGAFLLIPQLPGRANASTADTPNKHEILTGCFYGVIVTIMAYTAIRLLLMFRKYWRRNNKGSKGTATRKLNEKSEATECVSGPPTKRYILEVDGRENILNAKEQTELVCELREMKDNQV